MHERAALRGLDLHDARHQHVARGDAAGRLGREQDVARGKPEPDGYLRALELLGLRPEEAVAIEDSPPGVAAAQAAGLRCAALTRTFTAERLAGADLLAARVDRELIRRLVSSA